MTRCATCRVAYTRQDDPECETCQRRRRYGVIIEALACEVDEPPFARTTLDALDAIAEVMRDRHRLMRTQWKALSDEIREAQREATAAYSQGHYDANVRGHES